MAKKDNIYVKAFEFLSLVQDKKPTIDYKNHCIFSEGQISATNGILSSGFASILPIDNAKPNTYQMIAAFKICDPTNLKLSRINSHLIIKDDKSNIKVDLLSQDIEIPKVEPDKPRLVLPKEFFENLEKAALLSDDDEKDELLSTVLIKNHSFVGTNRKILIEVWHGFEIENELVVPIEFIKTLKKIKRKIESIGFSSNSLTIWFEDNFWLKTQLSQKEWPNVYKILDNVDFSNLIKIDDKFFDNIKNLEKLSKYDLIHIINSHISTDIDIEKATFIKTENYPNSKFKISDLLSLQDVVTHLDFKSSNNLHAFKGDNLRGIIAKIV